MAREQRIDQATVEVELAWEARADARRAVESAEVAVAVEQLLGERLTVTDVVSLTGLDQPTLRRLRQTKAALEKATAAHEPPAGGRLSDGGR